MSVAIAYDVDDNRDWVIIFDYRDRFRTKDITNAMKLIADKDLSYVERFKIVKGNFEDDYVYYAVLKDKQL